MNPILLTIAAAVMAVKSLGAEFALRDGDTVVFLGDSITAARQYSKVIETYTLLRFPERHIRFVNAGKGGETVKGSLQRLESAVFAEKATVLTVAYGVNDIGWGMKADAAHKQEYLDSLRQLIERCQSRDIRVFICSAAITAEDPDKAERGFLQKMCDEGLALAKSKGAGTIDVQRTMRTVQRRVLAANEKQKEKSKPTRMHVEDGVHLNELGQLAMAFAILKGLGAPADVSEAIIDSAVPSALTSDHCKVSDVRFKGGTLSFVRLDDRLPLNLQPLWTLQGMFIPLDELNRYELRVKNLPQARYEISAGGRPLGKWSSDALARGVNLSSATADPWVPGGPWDAQAQAVKVFTDMRDELVLARRNIASQLTEHPRLSDLKGRGDAMERNIVELQRATAQPVPVQFVVKPLDRKGNAAQ